MYTNRATADRMGVNPVFKNSVEEFLRFALSKTHLVQSGKLRCPCTRCKNRKFMQEDKVRLHLWRFGFVADYFVWTSHGEHYPSDLDQNRNERPIVMESFSSNPYRNMVTEGVNTMNWNNYGNDNALNMHVFGGQSEEEPNREAREFYKLLKDADE